MFTRCGAPAAVAQHVETYAREVPPDVFVLEQLLVEEWTYDPGPHAFVRDLVFRNGVLADVQLAGYGSR